MKRIDWPAAKNEYVNNAKLTYAEIAKKYRTTPGSVEQRAFREHWTAERAQRAKILFETVRDKSILDTVSELARYNEQDLAMAKVLRAAAARLIQDKDEELGPKDIRFLAGAVESAQRIARLALGASTENTDTRITEIDSMTPEQRRERIRQLHTELFPTVQ